MNLEVSTTKGATPMGGADAKRPGLKVPIEGRVFTQATESEPLPLVWGVALRAGTYILPVFNVTAVPVKQRMGK